MIFKLALYLLAGIAWAEWLERFCMNNLQGRLGEPFTTREKYSQILLWPIFLLVFIFNFLDDIFKRL